MIKAILADDEILAIKMLQKLIDWDRWGISICATASDGEEAYAAFERFQPELIITDIRMPRMDGLKFIEKVRKIDQHTEFILISAHADFSYVQQAMRMGCTDYVLKPIDEMELEKTLERSVKRLNAKSGAEMIKQREEIHKQKRLLSDYMKNGRETPALLTLKDMPHFSHCRLMSIEITSENASQYERVQQRIYDQKQYVDHVLEGILKDCGVFVLFDYEEESWLSLIRQSDTDKVVFCASRIIRFMKEDLNCTAIICFSDVGQTIKSLPYLYNKLMLLRKYSIYRQTDGISGYGYNCEESVYADLEFISQKNQMAYAIRRSDKKKALDLLRETLEWSLHMDPALLSNVYEFCYNAVLLARERFITEWPETEPPPALSITYAQLASALTLEKLRDLVTKAIEAIGDTGAVNKGVMQARHSRIVQISIERLRQKYAANISLDDICRELAISKNYFCFIFKKETGKRVWEYLTEIRLEQAKALLRDTDLTVFEIAYKVGYDNAGYFSKIFKRYYKMTPNEFRDILLS